MSAKFYHFLNVSVNLHLFRLPELWERQTKVHAIISPGGGAGPYRNLRPSQSSTIGHQNGKIWFCSTVHDCTAWIVSLITSHTKFQNSSQKIAYKGLKTVNNANKLQEWNLITINLRHDFAFKICARNEGFWNFCSFDEEKCVPSQTARKQLIWSGFQMLINWNDQAFKKK